MALGRRLAAWPSATTDELQAGELLPGPLHLVTFGERNWRIPSPLDVAWGDGGAELLDQASRPRIGGCARRELVSHWLVEFPPGSGPRVFQRSSRSSRGCRIAPCTPFQVARDIRTHPRLLHASREVCRSP